MNTDTAAPRKPWSKKKRYAVLGGVPLAIVGTTAAAAAIIAALAGVTGGGSTGTFNAEFKSGMSVAADYSGLVAKPGNATIVNKKLQLPNDLVLFPGESFTLRATITNEGSSAPGYVSGVALPGMPSGYTAELVTGCGGIFKLDDILEEVTIKISAAATQASGKAWTLTPEAGVQVSVGTKPADLVCPVYTAP